MRMDEDGDVVVARSRCASSTLELVDTPQFLSHSKCTGVMDP
jgi:hypothetical protein